MLKWPFFTALSLTAMTILSLTSTPCFAYVRCIAAPSPHHMIPNLSDCRLLLAHLPSITPSLHKHPPIQSRSSIPFLPRLIIRHKTCRFRYDYSIGRTELVRMEVIWADLRRATETIVDGCVANGMSGEFSGYAEGAAKGRVRLWISNQDSEPWQQLQNRQIQEARERIGQVPGSVSWTELRGPREVVSELKFRDGHYQV